MLRFQEKSAARIFRWTSSLPRQVQRRAEITAEYGFRSTDISVLSVSYCLGSSRTFNPYLGPRGAQYSPVCDMLKLLIHLIKDSAASSGVTAARKSSVHTFMADSEFTNLHHHPSTYQIQHPSSSLSSKPLDQPSHFLGLPTSLTMNPGCTIPTAIPFAFKSKLSNFPTIFSAALEAWCP